MLKRFGIFALMLAGSITLLQPTAALAQDRYDSGAYHHSENRRDFHRDRGDRRYDRRDDRRYYVAPAPNHYYAPAPNCGPYTY